jgi:hypothetical protein
MQMDGMASNVGHATHFGDVSVEKFRDAGGGDTPPLQDAHRGLAYGLGPRAVASQCSGGILPCVTEGAHV